MQSNNRPRKACDLCYTRKIKCDGLQPKCSNCVNYKTSCTHTARSRKWKPKALQDDEPQKEDEIRSLQAQMQELQQQLAQYKQATEIASVAPAPSPQADFQDDLAQVRKIRHSLKLPPLQQTMHMIGIYLNTVNALLPLFHSDTLLRLVGETYALEPKHRDPVVWAAINVVLAMALQQMPEGNSVGTPYGTTESYLSHAQSVLWAITLSQTQLINIQTLIGMAMLLQTGHDSTPALVIISTAMRLIHKIGLHNRAYSAHLDPVERQQHARVFWLAYIVDKDLSLRAQQPSIQIDEDIDLDFPMSFSTVSNGDSSAGVVTSIDGSTTMDYFLARVQLASIQGDIYDHLYSTRAWKRTPEERRLKRENIVLALNNWKASLPSDFGAADVIKTTRNNPSVGAFFCILHTNSLLSLMLITRAHAWDEQWVGVLRDHGRGVGTLQLPSDWNSLLGQARDFMILFEYVVPRYYWLKWVSTCTYISSMVLLTANNLHDLQHADFERDSNLIERALAWFGEIAKELPSRKTEVLENICVEAVQAMKTRRAHEIDVKFGGDWLIGFLNSLEPS
ncbi:fungal-specific transcription factor domain-containing protein [Fusarium sp. MPI-SDFR-AT-0072]|nr:fungal-specific transcription factor domain-containing protein [Fusarium sp. MPI-SDFR-AT-0072]